MRERAVVRHREGDRVAVRVIDHDRVDAEVEDGRRERLGDVHALCLPGVGRSNSRSVLDRSSPIGHGVLVQGGEADLARYYDQEAFARANRALDPQRVARREAFVDRLHDERVTGLIEVGTGPGRDARAFAAAGIGVVGVDLSVSHVRLARASGVQSVRASVYALPFADDVFDAGWTMSTLVHVPNRRFDTAMARLCRVIRPHGLLAVGLWGDSTDVEEIADWDTIAPKRFFSRRTDERVRAMLEPYGRVLEFDTWADNKDSTWHYQFVVIRRSV